MDEQGGYRPLATDLYRQTMKQHLYTSALIIWIAACGGDPDTREEVIERHEGGEKKVVAVYTGHGVNERLVERYTYDGSGEIVLHEDLLHSNRKNWLQLNPQLKTANGLESYLQGSWHSEKYRDKGDYSELHITHQLTIEGNRFSFISEGNFINYIDDWSDSYTITVQYRPDYIIETIADLGSEEIPLHIESKDRFTYGTGENADIFHRQLLTD
jgi:hypothetical protein